MRHVAPPAMRPTRTPSSSSSNTRSLLGLSAALAMLGVASSAAAQTPPAAPPAAPAAPPAAAAPAPVDPPKDGAQAPAATGEAATPGPVGEAPLLPARKPTPAPPAATVAESAAASGEALRGADAKSEVDAKPPVPSDPSAAPSPSQVFAEDWWSSAHPSFELHGYYRVRTELFSHFALGRKDAPANVIWPQPAGNDYVDAGGVRNRVILCGDNILKPEPCVNNVQAGANTRLRLNPELHISENIRVMAQLDLLDNLVLGSTPEGYANEPSDGGGYQARARGGYTPVGAFSSTQWSPNAGQNSVLDSISVKRAWGEYMSPVGLLRFGRMANHWGMGMFVNAGDGYDNDWGSTADRIMFLTGIKSLDLYFAGMWDFVNEGATSALINSQQGQPYDLTQNDDVSQWGLVVVRRRNPELQKLDLAHGDVVVNGGVFAVYREQSLEGASALGATSNQVASSLTRRDASAVIPDFWFQFLWKKFRFEAEATLVAGSIANTAPAPGINYDNPDVAGDEEDGWGILQFGIATQTEFRAIEDKLRVQAGFGYATGDQDVEGISPPAQGFDVQLTKNRTFSTFRFHPDYRIDLILWRNIFQRVQGAYYVRPSVEYDFLRDTNGQRLGGGGAVIWSRASQFVQAPGNAPDLGVELNFKLYYQAKDGSLNDDLDRLGGFYTQLEYGVLFPLQGLGYLPDEEAAFENAKNTFESANAQILRWYLGILF